MNVIEQARDKLKTMKTSQLIELVVDYKIWDSSGEASWAPCTAIEFEVAKDLIDERFARSGE